MTNEPDVSQRWKLEARAYFNAATKDYAFDRENFPWYQSQLSFAMASLVGCKGRVLDLGCAAGVEIATLRAAGFSVVGTDQVHQMLLTARQRLAQDSRVSITRADAEF